MRRVVLVLASMALAMVLVSGVALAVTKTCNTDCFGTNGPDRLIGTDNNNVMKGLKAGDSISGYRGEDTVYGNPGRDAVYGGLGDDKVYGGNGADYDEGDYGHDLIDTGSGNDKVAAKDGYKDRILCGSGFDKVYHDPFDVRRGCERSLDRKPRPPA
jgi:Ca2+-binding RTX toxin-like protein